MDSFDAQCDRKNKNMWADVYCSNVRHHYTSLNAMLLTFSICSNWSPWSRPTDLPNPCDIPTRTAACWPIARIVEPSKAQSSRPYKPILTTKRTAHTMSM